METGDKKAYTEALWGGLDSLYGKATAAVLLSKVR
jgi:hypothetical protein